MDTHHLRPRVGKSIQKPILWISINSRHEMNHEISTILSKEGAENWFLIENPGEELPQVATVSWWARAL